VTRRSRPALPVLTPRADAAVDGRTHEARTAPADLEPELLTRPMRLSDHKPHARRPRVDGTVAGV
jgi:hypothetical protein